MAASEQTFIIGATYYPRSSGPYWWEHFDQDEVAHDFEVAAELGLPLLRLVLNWEVFQPDRDRLSTRALRNFETVLELAASARLRVIPALLAPLLGGMLWLPAWALALKGRSEQRIWASHSVTTRPVRNFFTDPVLVAAEELLIREVVGNFHDHPSIERWQLADRLSRVEPPPSPDIAVEWTARFVQAVREYDREHLLLFGLDHKDLTQYHAIDPLLLREVIDGFTLAIPTAKDEPRTPWILAALTTKLAGAPPIIQGLGVCTTPAEGTLDSGCVSPEEAAQWTDEVLRTLVERGGASGALAPALYDASEELWTVPPYDRAPWLRTSGLLLSDGSPKPLAEVWSELARRRPIVNTEPTAVPDLDLERYWQELPTSYEEWERTLGALQ
jgi:hypothetical protein